MNQENDQGSEIRPNPESQPNQPDSEASRQPDVKGGGLGKENKEDVVVAVKQAAIDIVKAVNDQGLAITNEIKELRTDIESINNKLFSLDAQSSVGENSVDIDANIDQISGKKKPLVDRLVNALDSVVKATNEETRMIKDQQELFGSTKDVFNTYIEQTESQIPQELRNPTLERMKDRLTDKQKEEIKDTDKWNEKSEIYQEAVEDWFEERIREMETIELSFEEQQESYRYLSLYANNFVLKKDTKQMGERIREKLETRRIRHRVVRIWNLAGPEGILGEAGRITTSTFAKFFKTENIGSYSLDKSGNRIPKLDKDGHEIKDALGKPIYERENQVEEELRNYERMMRILGERRNEYRSKIQNMMEETKLKKGKIEDEDRKDILEDLEYMKDEIDIKERYIVDYFRYGGSVEDKSLEDAYIPFEKDGNRFLREWNGNIGEKSNDNENGFFYKLGAAKRDEEGNVVYKIKTDSKGNVVYKKDSKGNFKLDKDTGDKIPKNFAFIEKDYTRKDLVRSQLDDPNNKLEKSEKKEYRDKIWARRYAGGLSSMMFRITKEAQLNGSGDFYANRILNFADKLSGNTLMRGSKGIWDPETGSFKDDQFDIGYVDIMSDMLKKADVDDMGGVGMQSLDKEENGRIKSFENLKWGEDKLWDDLIDKKLKTPEGNIVIRMTYFNDADNTRKKLWGADSFFHRPTLEGMVGMEGAFGHMGTGKAEYEVKNANGDPMRDNEGEPIVIKNISGIEKKWIEMLDRSLEYLKTSEAEDWLGDPTIGYSQRAEIRIWLNSAVKNGTIDGATRSVLLKKHLGTDNPFLLNRMTELDIWWAHMRHNRATLAWQTFMEFLRTTFGNVFSEDIGRR